MAAPVTSALECNCMLLYSALLVLLWCNSAWASDPFPPPPTVPTSSMTSTRNFSSVWDAVTGLGNLSFVQVALNLGNLERLYSDPTLTATFFLPTDQAFLKLTASLGYEANVLALAPHQASLTKALMYHQLASRVSIAAVAERLGSAGGTEYYGTMLTSARSARVGVQVSPASGDGAPNVSIRAVSSTAKVVQQDIVAGAAYVNTLDTLLTYWYDTVDQAFASTNDTSNIYQALRNASLLPPAGVRGVYTIFAPTDQAFAAAAGGRSDAVPSLLSDLELLKSHVVDGDVASEAVGTSVDMGPTEVTTLSSKKLTVVAPSPANAMTGARSTVALTAVAGAQNATILDTVQVGIGPSVIIHVIDRVLVPPTTATSSPPLPLPSPSPPSPPVTYAHIWDAINRTDNLLMLKTALLINIMHPMYMNPDLNTTVFLPTDQAFIDLILSLGLDPGNLLSLAAYSSTLTKALSYHRLASRVRLGEVVEQLGAAGGTEYFGTTLTSARSALVGVQVSPASGDGAPNVSIRAVSSTAKVVQQDIVAGAAYVNVVDTILRYWYDTVDQAFLSTNGTTTIYQALRNASLLPQHVKEGAVYTIFAPTDQAFSAVTGGSSDLMAALLREPELLRSHLVAANVHVDANTITDTSTIFTTNSSMNVTVTVPSYDNAQAGARSTVALANVPGAPAATILDTVQVGIGPSVIIHVIDRVLVPTYTTAWQYLTSVTGFENLAALIRLDNSSLLTALQDPNTSGTLLAPTNKGLAALAATYGVNGSRSGNVSRPDQRLRAVLRNHVSARAVSYTALAGRTSLDTLAGAVNVRVAANGVIVITGANGSTADVVAPYNVTVLYGRLYIHSLSAVLLTAAPSDVDGGSAAAAPAPSSLLLLMMLTLVAALAAPLAI